MFWLYNIRNEKCKNNVSYQEPKLLIICYVLLDARVQSVSARYSTKRAFIVQVALDLGRYTFFCNCNIYFFAYYYFLLRK